MTDHQPVTTRRLPNALREATVTAYCPACGVPWPCPQAAQDQDT